MPEQPDDTIQHQDDVEAVIAGVEETSGHSGFTNTAIANPGTISGTFQQAEVTALRTSIISILTALRANGIVAP